MVDTGVVFIGDLYHSIKIFFFTDFGTERRLLD